MKVAIYVRVSKSDGSQDTERQIQDLRQFCQEQQWEVVLEVRENVSGRKKKRAGTEQLIRAAKSNQIQKALVHAVDRLGRNAADVYQTVEQLAENHCSVYSYQERMETLVDGRKTQYALMILPLLAGFAEQWTNDHSHRIKSGLKLARDKGVQLGRPAGKPIKNEKEILACLLGDKSLRETEKEVGISRGTVISVKKKYAYLLENKDDQQIEF